MEDEKIDRVTVDSRSRKIIGRVVNGDRVITLAEIGGYHPYVTWASRADRPDDTFWGHYFADIDDAMEDFTHRVKRGY